MIRRLDQSAIRYGKDGEIWVRSDGPLTERWVQTPDPLLEQVRQYYGRALTPEAIEQTIIRADNGYMRDLTDLIAEASRVDPHWSMCDGKRLRAAASIKPKVVPAETDNEQDAKLAAEFADVVRRQLAWLGNLRQIILRLNWGHKNGRAAAEKVWKENSADSKFKWRIDAIHWIHPRRLSFGPERELRVRDDLWGGMGFEARGLDLRQYPHKFIGFLPQLFDEYPEREGYGVRGLYHSFFKRFGWREELVLLEVFGRPWRTLQQLEGATVNKETLDNAAEQIDEASANATMVAPPGTQLVTDQPGQGAGQVHTRVKQDANDEMSKLVLGEVRTSDAKPGALGSQGEAVALEVQTEVKAQDCWNLSDLLTEGISVSVIGVNYGLDAIHLAPRVELPYELPPDRTVEIDRTHKAFSIGLPLKEDEVYERLGFTKPEAGDAVVRQAPQPAGPFGQEPPPNAEGGTMPSGDEPPAPPDGTDPTLAAPPDFLTFARAAHILELARYASAGERVVRGVIPKPPQAPPKTET